MLFRDRHDAGRQLAQKLAPLAEHHPVVLALPRGGVPVAYEIAQSLHAPLDVLVARKLGAPGHKEFGIGAVAEGGGRYIHPDTSAILSVTPAYLERVEREERAELERRVRTYRAGEPPIDCRGRLVILVDDGLATGATIHAALRSVRKQAPMSVVLAVPVCEPEAARALEDAVEEVVCTWSPLEFSSVSQWYDDFEQTSDDEVVLLLARARSEYQARLQGMRKAAERARIPGVQHGDRQRR
ncbi:MAG: phosphoribosyltransferase [Myxococcales bacterium]